MHLHVHPHCHMLDVAVRHCVNTTPQVLHRSPVVRPEQCDTRSCVWTQVLEHCLIFFCDVAAAGKHEAGTLVKRLGGEQARAPDSHAAADDLRLCTTMVMPLSLGVTGRAC